MNKKRNKLLSIIIIMSMIVAPFTATSATAAEKPVMAKQVAIKGNDAVVIAIGKTQKLQAKITPKNVTSSKIKWTSNDSSVVTVTSKGIIKGIGEGTAKVTATAQDGSYKKDSITVTVGTPVTKISVSKKIVNLIPGKSTTIKTTVAPKKATLADVVYTSSNTKVAKVTKNGKINAIGGGKAVITVKAADGSGTYSKVDVNVKAINRTLTESDVKNGKISIANLAYDRLIIDNSVGDAEIVLNKVTVRDAIKMASDASYVVKAKNSNINNVIALEEEQGVIKAFAVEDEVEVKESPTFIAETGTLVVNVDAKGNVTVRQEGKATIQTVTVNRSIWGELELNLDGFQGNLVVNTQSNSNITINTKSCNIQEASVSGIYTGQNISFSDSGEEDTASTIGKFNVDIKADIRLDIPVNELVIADTVESTSITVEKPIDKIVNAGNKTNLTINSNVTDVVSAGNGLILKVAAGSAVKAMDVSGNSAEITVALGSTVESITSKGNENIIAGAGSVGQVQVKGNNVSVNTPNTKVTVSDNVSGTTANGTGVSAGTTINNGPPAQSTTPSGSGGGSSSTNPTNPIPPTTGMKISILDPGKIWEGKSVQFKADVNNVTWSVYSYIDNTSGYATINTTTGLLQAYSPGVVRIVATSKLNQEVYGAVDVTIYGKKYVGYESLEVTIDTEGSLIDLESLEAAGKLPKSVNLIYETGNGKETEKIAVDFPETYWYGDYRGDVIGNNIAYRYIDNLVIPVLINVKVPQTDNRKLVTSYTPIEPITITEDKHLINIRDLILDKTLNLYESDMNFLAGTEGFTAKVNGYTSDEGNQFNGAVPGHYNIQLFVRLPLGYTQKNVEKSNNYVYWYYNNTFVFNVDVDVQIAQTPQTPQTGGDYVIPDTTQARFTGSDKKAVIQAISFTNLPTEMTAGEVVDLNEYLNVLTDTGLLSDARVKWSVNGYNNNNIISDSGVAIFSQIDKHIITATSMIDNTKSVSAKINIINNKSLSYPEMSMVTIGDDQGIVNFNLLVTKLENQLPTKVEAVSGTGETVIVPIDGWIGNEEVFNNGITSGETIYMHPNFRVPKGYSIDDGRPSLEIHFTADQNYNRTNIVSGSAIAVTLSEDKYATNEYKLREAIFGYSASNHETAIAGLLDDGTVVQLQCTVLQALVSYPDNQFKIYDGSSGIVNMELKLQLPEAYSHNDSDQITVVKQIEIMVDQTPRYEQLWVAIKPKLVYKVGDTLDLSGMSLLIRDTTQDLTTSDAYISPEQFEGSGIVLRLTNSLGTIIDQGSSVTLDMNNNSIYVYNSINNSSVSFGPLVVTEQ